uniref:Uncharacterized protein n=1 Tax=Heterorhabditis bacteriophora TaxID=37862 RepID=A0A1I7WT18_HETBA
MTEEDDIGFAIHFDPSLQADNLTEMDTVYPYIRLECTNVPIAGHFIAERAGNFHCFYILQTLFLLFFYKMNSNYLCCSDMIINSDIIEFDNYYSWFSAKQLRYNIEIEEL